MTPPAQSAVPEALRNVDLTASETRNEDQEQLATVRQLHPYGIPIPLDYVYAPLESAELQTRDNLRRELGASALALKSDTSERGPACDENLVYHQVNRGHSMDMSTHYAELAKGAEQMFWTVYADAIIARQAIAED